MKRVLFVCTGNICRSPTAEGVFRHLIQEAGLAGAIESASAGTHGYHIGDPPDQRTIAAAKRYFAGEKTDFSHIALALDDQEEFFRRIYEALRRIGWGETTTYGALAKQLGAGPEAARDVGIAMSRNPVPLIIPCHRCLAAGNKLGGFSAPGGTNSKIRMLALEGLDLAPKPPAQASLF